MTINNPFNPDDLTSKQVDQYHTKDDVDSAYSAHHHTLGWSVNQAASGFDVKKALDANDSNLAMINQNIADIQAQTAILDKVGRKTSWYTALTSTVPNGGTAPFTSFAGWTVVRNDNGTNTNSGWAGLIYDGLGVWHATEDVSLQLEAGINWASSSAGRRILFITLNTAVGTDNSWLRLESKPSVTAYQQQHSWTMDLLANETINLSIYQDSGAALARSTTGGMWRDGVAYSMMFSATRIL